MRGDSTERLVAHRRRRLCGTSIGLNLTSMIDVTFLLLVYFMVATEFRTSESQYPMDLPKRQVGTGMLLDDQPLVVHVESTGDRAWDCRVRLDGPWEPVSGIDGLHRFLRKYRADGFGNDGLFTPDHPIVIRPSAEARWDHAMAAYNAAAAARYSNITLGEPG
jgi:biopolymer transport protein ExbD